MQSGGPVRGIKWLSRQAILLVSACSLPAHAQITAPREKPNPALVASLRSDVPLVDGPWRDRALPAERRAELLLAAMTLDEKLLLLRGFNGGFIGGRSRDPLIGPGQRLTSGYVPGVPRLGIPAIHLNDSVFGVTNGFDGHAARPGDEATAMPSMQALTASFDPSLAHAEGRAVANEFRARGFNLILGPSMNLARDPRGGRNFEYLGGEDPLLSGILAGQVARGIQSRGVMSTLKHYALHGQTRHSDRTDAVIGEAALRESDLLAFEIAVEAAQPAAVMCAYNFVNGVRACHNDFLLNVVLKGDWDWKGFVLSDWGAVRDTAAAALGGLDQQSAWTWDRLIPYFGFDALKAGIASGQIPQSRIDDMARRVLWGMISTGVYDDPPRPGGSAIEKQANGRIAREIATRGMVLLKNDGNLLPLAAGETIALIGGRADLGVLTGGGSSTVTPYGGLARIGSKPTTTQGPEALPARDFGGEGLYIRQASPLAALRAKFGAKTVTFDSGVNLEAAAAAARSADVAIVVVNQINAEASDPMTLALPGGQDELVAAVAAANPRTIVLVQSGNPVLMPWLPKVRSVLAIWYPGQHGGAAIADILAGDAAPSGRLPISFPRTDLQRPRPEWPGVELWKDMDAEGAQAFKGPPPALITPDGKALLPPRPDAARVTIDYNIEGSDVGYRWFARAHQKPLFPFGFGLTYTSFRFDGLRVSGGDTPSATFTVTNTGKRAAFAVPQIYVQLPDAKIPPRLAGWQAVSLKPGESKTVTIAAEPRILASYDTAKIGWQIAAGTYRISLGASAGDIEMTRDIRLEARLLEP